MDSKIAAVSGMIILGVGFGLGKLTSPQGNSEDSETSVESSAMVSHDSNRSVRESRNGRESRLRRLRDSSFEDKSAYFEKKVRELMSKAGDGGTIDLGAMCDLWEATAYFSEGELMELAATATGGMMLNFGRLLALSRLVDTAPLKAIDLARSEDGNQFDQVGSMIMARWMGADLQSALDWIDSKSDEELVAWGSGDRFRIMALMAVAEHDLAGALERLDKLDERVTHSPSQVLGKMMLNNWNSTKGRQQLIAFLSEKPDRIKELNFSNYYDSGAKEFEEIVRSIFNDPALKEIGGGIRATSLSSMSHLNPKLCCELLVESKLGDPGAKDVFKNAIRSWKFHSSEAATAFIERYGAEIAPEWLEGIEVEAKMVEPVFEGDE